jgi:hypothetical protein
VEQIEKKQHAMSNADQTKSPSMQRVEALKTIQPDRYELWKYYEDRADRLGERMWSVGIWLITLIIDRCIDRFPS